MTVGGAVNRRSRTPCLRIIPVLVGTHITERLIMGAIHVNVTVRNPAEPHRAWEGTFSVNPGSMNCFAPRKHLESIGLRPEYQRTYGLADGSEITVDITGARVEFMGGLTWVAMAMGEDDAEPLLGLTALESVGIAVDPETQTLKRMPYVRMRGFRPAADRPAVDRQLETTRRI